MECVSKAYASYMEMGGYVVAVAYFFWTSQRYLFEILWSFFSRTRSDPNQPIAEPWVLPC